MATLTNDIGGGRDEFEDYDDVDASKTYGADGCRLCLDDWQQALMATSGPDGQKQSEEARTNVTALTPREAEVLSWVARGKLAWEIGEILNITKGTVDDHVHRATRKIGAANRTHAVAIAIRDGIIEI